MAEYRLTDDPNWVFRTDDRAMIPNDPANAAWKTYLAWLAQGNIAAPVSGPTLAQQYAAAINAGCAIVSAGMPTISATYPIDPASVSDMTAEAQFVSSFSEFSNGEATMIWATVGGSVTFPSTAAAMSVFKACAQYVTAWKQYSTGIVSEAPVAPVNIA